MTCRQPINRPLPGQQYIQMKDYVDRGEKFADLQEVVEFNVDISLAILVAGLIVGFLFGGGAMKKHENTQILHTLETLDNAFDPTTVEYDQVGVMDAHTQLRVIAKPKL